LDERVTLVLKGEGTTGAQGKPLVAHKVVHQLYCQVHSHSNEEQATSFFTL